METLSAMVHAALVEVGPTELLALRRSQKHLCWFLPLAMIRTMTRSATGHTRQVFCGDAVVLAALAPVLRRRPGVDVTVLVHGLDLIWSVPLYRRWVRRGLRRADRVLTNSTATRDEALALGVPAERITVLLPGLPVPPDVPRDPIVARKEAAARLGTHLDGLLLVTVGRLVRRKGVRWFAEHVVPRLPDGATFVVAGTGPELEPVREAVTAASLGDRVKVLGLVSDEVRDALLDGADAFVAPNVHVPDDMEGFGLVVAEAALRGTPVVAAAVEGLRDAVVEDRTGWLCPSEDADAFVERLCWLAERSPEERDALRRSVAQEARARFSSARMTADLVRVLGRD